MAYIDYVDDSRYEAEVKSGSGTVANILRVHGIEPDVGRAHLALYKTIMFGVSKVTGLEREAIAVAVSAANKCHY
jgi:alkylhydroperoxidase family enzyme